MSNTLECTYVYAYIFDQNFISAIPMAKITGPLFSTAAHGLLGPRLCYSHRSRNVCRIQRPQRDANTAQQQTQRYFFSLAATAWGLLTDDEKKEWTYTCFMRWFITAYRYGNVTTWTIRKPLGDTKSYWLTIASDSTGRIIAATSRPGYVYISTNYGITFSDRTPFSLMGYWYRPAISFLADTIYVAQSYDYIYVTHDYGVTWTKLFPSGSTDFPFRDMCCSDDGVHAFCGEYNGQVNITHNSGLSWAAKSPKGGPSGKYVCIACSSDGAHVITIDQLGSIYISHDYGDSWSENCPAGHTSDEWTTVACMPDFSYAFAAARLGRIFKYRYSTDSWHELFPLGDQNIKWFSLDCSLTPSVLFVSAYPYFPLISRDLGDSWYQIDIGYPVATCYKAVTLDLDASHMAIAGSNDYLYTSP